MPPACSTEGVAGETVPSQGKDSKGTEGVVSTGLGLLALTLTLQITARFPKCGLGTTCLKVKRTSLIAAVRLLGGRCCPVGDATAPISPTSITHTPCGCQMSTRNQTVDKPKRLRYSLDGWLSALLLCMPNRFSSIKRLISCTSSSSLSGSCSVEASLQSDFQRSPVASCITHLTRCAFFKFIPKLISGFKRQLSSTVPQNAANSLTYTKSVRV
jgi:hypothetical protein